MEQGREESDIEGLATHDGPESCVGVREDGGEALAGERAGRATEPRNHTSGVQTPSARRNATSRAALARVVRGPRAVREPGMYGSSMRENRESPASPGPRSGAGRSGKAEAASPR